MILKAVPHDYVFKNNRNNFLHVLKIYINVIIHTCTCIYMHTHLLKLAFFLSNLYFCNLVMLIIVALVHSPVAYYSIR